MAKKRQKLNRANNNVDAPIRNNPDSLKRGKKNDPDVETGNIISIYLNFFIDIIY